MRCQYKVTEFGQCLRHAQPGSDFCEQHSPETLQQRLYRISRAKGRYYQHAESSEVKSLRDEIAIARTLLEERWNQMKEETDVLAAVGPINTLLVTIEKLVSSCQKLEASLGSLLAKPTLLSVAQQIVGILIEELQGVPGYERLIDRISDRIIKTIAETKA